MNALPRDDSSGHRSTIKRYVIEHYDELHDMAARQMARENPGNSLQASALVNEAVCQMLDRTDPPKLNDSEHFLANANIMMKHILVDHARCRNNLTHGGNLNRHDLNSDQEGRDQQMVKLLILQEEIQLLTEQDFLAGQIVQKRCEGYSIEEAAAQLKLSRSQAYDKWTCGRAWLLQKFHQGGSQSD
ncbi:MAG: ECF-type sigma factor [Gemmatales bacterium]